MAYQNQRGLTISGSGIQKQFMQTKTVVVQNHARMSKSNLHFEGNKEIAIVGEDRAGSEAGFIEVTATVTDKLKALLTIINNSGNKKTIRAEDSLGDFKGFVVLEKLPLFDDNNEVTFKFLFETNELVA